MKRKREMGRWLKENERLRNYRAYFVWLEMTDDDDGINRSRREGRAPLAKPGK